MPNRIRATFSRPSGARSSATKIAADIDVSANRLSTLPRLNTILYSIHAALVQNKAKHIDPISNFIIFIRYPGFVYLMSTEMIWFRYSTKLVGMQELFSSLSTRVENGEVR